MKPSDSAQGRPFDAAQGRPFDAAQGRPFDAAHTHGHRGVIVFSGTVNRDGVIDARIGGLQRRRSRGGSRQSAGAIRPLRHRTSGSAHAGHDRGRSPRRGTGGELASGSTRSANRSGGGDANLTDRQKLGTPSVRTALFRRRSLTSERSPITCNALALIERGF
jgi:hypothetical protein